MTDPKDNIILGILSECGAPCIEAPDSPHISTGEAETLLSSDTDNPPSSEFFQDIRSVRAITVKRVFTCLKEDYNDVRNWLAGLDGRALQVNVGKNGKSVLAGGFRLTGPIEMQSESPSLGKVEAEWRGYILDCNIDLAPSISFRKDSDTQWSILCGDTVVLTATSNGPGDGSGLLIVPGEIVTWNHLPDDVRETAPEYDLISSKFPSTPEECIAVMHGGSYSGYYAASRSKGNGWESSSSRWINVTFPSDHFALLSKWKALRLVCNGEVVVTWWVQVSCFANSVGASIGTRVFPVYYGQTLPEMTSENEYIHGPIDITDSNNGRLATNIAKTDAVIEYGGLAGPDAWATRPEIYFSSINAVTVPDKIPRSYDYIFIEPTETGSKVWLDTLQIDGLVRHTAEGNSWAFEAFPGDTAKSIRFWTPPRVFVSSVYVSPAGQVTVRTYSVLWCYNAKYDEREGAPQMIALEGSWNNPKIGKWWQDTVTWKEYVQMMRESAAFSENIEVAAEEDSSSSGSSSSSSSSSGSSSSGEYKPVYLTPRGFMDYMEGQINEWLVENGYLSSVDDANAFHYDLDWTSRDICQVCVGQDLPDHGANPVYIDADALNSEAGFLPREYVKADIPAEFRTINLAQRTTNTDPYAPFSTKGCFSCADTWTKTVNGQTSTVTYEDVFATIIGRIDRAGLLQGRRDARKPSKYSIYAARTALHFPDSEVVPVPIACYGLVGYICAPDEALTGEPTTDTDGSAESTIRLFWREDDRYVTLLANNAYGRNPLLTFDKKPEADESSSSGD